MKERRNRELPKWFKGVTYDEGDVVENRFTGQSIELNNIELSMYDFVMGASLASESGWLTTDNEIVRDLRNGIILV